MLGIDPRTKEEQKVAAVKCFETIMSKGRRSCGGCHLDHYCGMPEFTGKWLREEFLPAIDPSGQTFGYPEEEVMGGLPMSELTRIIAGKGNISDLGDGTLFKEIEGRITCQDKTTLSVQASHYHYCTPRDDTGPYTQVEVGFPDAEPPDTWSEYFDGDWEKDNRCDSVYGWVPVSLVELFIESHGGEVES